MGAEPQLARVPRSVIIGSEAGGDRECYLALFCFILRPPAQMCDMGKRPRSMPLLKEKNSEEKQI